MREREAYMLSIFRWFDFSPAKGGRYFAFELYARRSLWSNRVGGSSPLSKSGSVGHTETLAYQTKREGRKWNVTRVYRGDRRCQRLEQLKCRTTYHYGPGRRSWRRQILRWG